MNRPNNVHNHVNQAQAELSKRSFYHFVKTFWDVIISEPMQDNWHIKYLCDEFQDTVHKVINKEKIRKQNIVINISPGSSKSTIFSVMGPVWAWVQDPTLKILTGSHTTSLALDLAVKSRDIIRSTKFQDFYPDIKLKDDTDTKSVYGNTLNGERVSTSVGSSVIGKHFHMIIVDDPVKTTASETEFDKATKWLTQELSTRKIDKGNCPTVLIMQRLGYTDPAGILLEQKKTKQIKLPAEVTSQEAVVPTSAFHYYEQIDNKYYMDTTRLSPSLLEDMRVTLGTKGYASQFLQEPDPMEDGIIKRNWIRVQPRTQELLRELNTIEPHFFIDTAYTDNKSNDPSCVISVKKYNNQLYIMDGALFYEEFTGLVNKITYKLMENGYNRLSKVYIEPKASGLSVVQYLKSETSYNVIEDTPPRESKDDRLRGISPIVEAGRLICIEGSWNEEYLDQLTAFKPIHDEYRDVTVMAINNLLMTNTNRSSGEYTIRRLR